MKWVGDLLSDFFPKNDEVENNNNNENKIDSIYSINNSKFKHLEKKILFAAMTMFAKDIGKFCLISFLLI
jgi:hypothetical protein